MAADEISLSEIEDALHRVQGEKDALLAAVREKEAEEERLTRFAEDAREFLARWRTDGKGTAAGPGRRYVAPVMGAVEYAVLALMDQPTREGLDTNPLISLMQAEGFTSGAQSVYLSVFGALNRAAKRPDGPIVKVNKKWALREWYPDGVPVQDDEEDDDKEKVIPPPRIANPAEPFSEISDKDLEELLAE